MRIARFYASSARVVHCLQCGLCTGHMRIKHSLLQNRATRQDDLGRGEPLWCGELEIGAPLHLPRVYKAPLFN